MSSRLWRKGTIVARVRNLLRAGVLKEKPVWLDVVEAFPPLVEPQYNRKSEAGKPPLIEYPEDKLTEKFYDVYRVPSVNIFETAPEEMKSTLFVRRQMEVMKDTGVTEHEAFQVASSDFMKFSRKAKRPPSPLSHVKDVIPESKEGSEQENQLNALLGYFKSVRNGADSKQEQVNLLKKTIVQTNL